MSTSRAAGAGNMPAVPPARRPSEPEIEVSGVRSSWLTVETNSVFICSMRLRSLMSRTIATMSLRVPIAISLSATSAGKRVPFRRCAVFSCTFPMPDSRPCSVGSEAGRFELPDLGGRFDGLMRLVSLDGTAGASVSLCRRLGILPGPRSSSSFGRAPFQEGQPFEIVDEVGEADLDRGARQADRADEQIHAILLFGEDVLDA